MIVNRQKYIRGLQTQTNLAAQQLSSISRADRTNRSGSANERTLTNQILGGNILLLIQRNGFDYCE